MRGIYHFDKPKLKLKLYGVNHLLGGIAMTDEEKLELQKYVDNRFKTFLIEIDRKLETLEIPDTKGLVSKKNFLEFTDEIKRHISDEMAKTNEQVTKIANETDVKITELKTTRGEWKNWFKTILDY